MAALTADRETSAKDVQHKWYPVAAVKIYKGSIVALNTSGYVVPASDTANLRVVGVAVEFVDNSGGAAGDKKVRVERGRAFKFAASSITQAMVGDIMYIVDDQTFDDGLGTNVIKAGRLVEFVSTTEGWIYIDNAGQGTALADADATYGQPEADLINAIKASVNLDILG